MLSPLQNSFHRNPLIKSFLKTDLKDAAIIAEFSFQNCDSTFTLFHCKKSSKYILYLGIEKEYMNFSEESDLNKYYIRESMEEVMEVASDIIRAYYWNPRGGDSSRWWSYLPDWIFLTPESISDFFNQFAQKIITEMVREINPSDFTISEKQALGIWSSNFNMDV